jgi:hypothetical protein
MKEAGSDAAFRLQCHGATAKQSVVAAMIHVDSIIDTRRRPGLVMHPRTRVLRALNRNIKTVLNSDRKDPHWTRRKPKRGECLQEPPRQRQSLYRLRNTLPLPSVETTFRSHTATQLPTMILA